MKKSKKIYGLILAIVMTISVLVCVNIVAFASTQGDNKCGENVTYHFDEKSQTLTISGTGAMYDYGDGSSPFIANNDIKALVVENGVTSVGDYAFAWCDELNSVYLGDDVASVGIGAFQKNNYFTISLDYIRVPNTLATVEYDAFLNCDVMVLDYIGTEEEYNNFIISPSVGQNNETLTGSLIVKTLDTPKGEIVKNGGNVSFKLEDGTLVKNDLREIDGSIYYFDGLGNMVKGLYETIYVVPDDIPDGPSAGTELSMYRYFGKDGRMATKEWVEFYGDWSYFDSYGVRAENMLVKFDNYYEYCFDNNGRMITGWYSCDVDGSLEPVYFYPNGIMAKNTWLKKDGQMVYINSFGIIAREDIVYDYDKSTDSFIPYYVDKNGHKLSWSWAKYYNEWVYTKGDGSLLTNSWVLDSVGWLYLGDDGFIIKDSFVKDSHGYLYADSNGYPLVSNQAVSYGGELFATDSNGYLRSGWVYFDLTKYDKGYEWVYFDSNGFQVRNQLVNDSWGRLYVDSDGFIVKNAIVKVNGEKYGFDENGYMVYGWYMFNGQWHYFNNDGTMLKNSWVADSHGWLYADYNGDMICNDWSIDYRYYFNEYGYMVTGWYYVNSLNTWIFYGYDGVIVKSSWVMDSHGWCYVDEDGYLVTSDWVYYNGNCYYLDEEGHMVTGLIVINGHRYDFGYSGALIG